jgi:hypothetical protein
MVTNYKGFKIGTRIFRKSVFQAPSLARKIDIDYMPDINDLICYLPPLRPNSHHHVAKIEIPDIVPQSEEKEIQFQCPKAQFCKSNLTI